MPQSRLLSGTSSSSSSSDGGSGLLLLSRKLAATPIPWTRRDGCCARRKAGRVVASAARGEQDHYAVLGISRRASAADVKRAYRLLARKYHPDVSQDARAGELFKSIHLAYEVLSDEKGRSRYDREVRLREGAPPRPWPHDPVWTDGRMNQWAELRQQMWQRRRERAAAAAGWASRQGGGERRRRSSDTERGPFGEVLWSTFFSLFLMRAVGARISLTVTGLLALFDPRLDGGYKMGYLTAWVLGGQGGVLLAVSISFASWVWGKSSSGIVALAVLVMWVSGRLAATVPLPQGAILTLLYMSMKLQSDDPK
ncbi:unnamed protein product [Spirodela intermedia]|uniref:J domain-containing protein n=1 Tax=Spirodela intermedia TaxID=51605 RepID=A0A7I8KNU4_SPIIN|nr:unnamed protein product [Spirodela intermedia]